MEKSHFMSLERHSVTLVECRRIAQFKLPSCFLSSVHIIYRHYISEDRDLHYESGSIFCAVWPS